MKMLRCDTPMSSTDYGAKTDVMNDFLKFVDNNSTPNGRQADSRCPIFYFLPKFQRIEPPKPDEKDFDKKAFMLLSERVQPCPRK